MTEYFIHCIFTFTYCETNFFFHSGNVITHSLEAVFILPPKCQRQRLGWSYCAASPKLGRNQV